MSGQGLFMRIKLFILLMISTQSVHSKEFNYCEFQAPQTYTNWGDEGTVFVGEGNYQSSIGRFLISDGAVAVDELAPPNSQLVHESSEEGVTYSLYKELVFTSTTTWVLPTLIISDKDTFVYIHNIKLSELELMFIPCSNINSSDLLGYYRSVLDLNKKPIN